MLYITCIRNVFFISSLSINLMFVFGVFMLIIWSCTLVFIIPIYIQIQIREFCKFVKKILHSTSSITGLFLLTTKTATIVI